MGVITGLDRLRAASFAPLRGRRVGLLAHPASVDRTLAHAWDLMTEARVSVDALFGPEHGFAGVAQDMEAVSGERVAAPRAYSLYGDTEASLRPTAEMMRDLDVVVVDLQDVGARYYTYAATLAYLMEAAATFGVAVMVLDRPNPLGGREEDVEGPTVQPGFRSFVSELPIPVRHGLTMAELATMIREQRHLDVELEIVKMEGWRRELDFDECGLTWVLPSPNMPTLDTALVYPGQCLFEGTRLSEGRGTTRPFELVGAPWIDGAAWARRASSVVGPGVALRPASFRPMFQKHARTTCGGVQLHVTDRRSYRSVHAAAGLLWAAVHLYPDAPRWREEAYEFVEDRLAIDLLFGSEAPRSVLESGAPWPDVAETLSVGVESFRQERRRWLLYR